jgi:hypothetical protein
MRWMCSRPVPRKEETCNILFRKREQKQNKTGGSYKSGL